jgi:DNA mismatch repair protein MutL
VGRVQEATERYLASTEGEVAVGIPFPRPAAVEAADAGVTPLIPAGPATVLGQHRNTYIVATDGEDLLLLDQHTAHERVRFERLQAALAREGAASQILLAPLVVTIAPALRSLLDAETEGLRRLGFDVEPFGGGAIRVRAVPAALGTRDPGPALERILGEVLDREATDWIVPPSDRLAATLACHTSVRAGEPLGPETMTAIVRDLAQAAHPDLCPHGRPTRVRLPREDVSRWFERSGWRRQ